MGDWGNVGPSLEGAEKNDWVGKKVTFIHYYKVQQKMTGKKGFVKLNFVKDSHEIASLKHVGKISPLASSYPPNQKHNKQQWR